jgi:hypothetical protein
MTPVTRRADQYKAERTETGYYAGWELDELRIQQNLDLIEDLENQIGELPASNRLIYAKLKESKS